MRRLVIALLALLAAAVTARAVLASIDRRRRSMSRREHVALVLHREADRRLSRVGVWVMRRTRGGPADRFKVKALVLTTTGRRSGQPRSVVLQCFDDGDDYMVVATNDGADRPPAWFLNLEADPDVLVEFRDRRMDARAEVLDPGDAAGWWERILELAPDYERYARATARSFPVVRLRPQATGGGTAAQ
jgi:deazaflavin-dependent oxidoreductase (nitroreductase family)